MDGALTATGQAQLESPPAMTTQPTLDHCTLERLVSLTTSAEKKVSKHGASSTREPKGAKRPTTPRARCALHQCRETPMPPRGVAPPWRRRCIRVLHFCHVQDIEMPWLRAAAARQQCCAAAGSCVHAVSRHASQWRVEVRHQTARLPAEPAVLAASLYAPASASAA